MVNLTAPLCLDCDKRSSFGFPGDKAEYCKKHSHVGMIILNNRKCLRCTGRACYGFPGKKTQYCGKHKTKYMIVAPLRAKKRKCLDCKENVILDIININHNTVIIIRRREWLMW